MNMKKTIAAIAACAVAVSAMATTVSAEEGKLTYNLVKKVYGSEGKATFEFKVADLSTTGLNNVAIVLTNGTNGVVTLDGDTVYTITTYNVETSGEKVNFNNWTVKGGAGVGSSTWVDAANNTINIPVGNDGIVAHASTYISVKAEVKHNSSWDGNLASGGSKVTATANGVAMDANLVAFTGASDTVKEYPMKTDLNAGKPTSKEIISYLEGKDGNGCNSLASKDHDYVNVKAVLNDIIANYDDVTFTFNTATKNVDDNGMYCADWEGSDQYKGFGQHLYNLFGDENTGYVYTSAYDWSYYNLFSGALIINDGLSMSLNDTNTFDYGKTSISFNWADATDGATVNTYVTYLQSMRLATSTKWYWDSMDVVFSNTEAEDTTIESDAAAEVEDDEIADEEVAEEEEAPAEEEEAPAEEEEAPAEEEAPVAEATNPGTGNAPIALAVIPVALAAAAVVAKKRG